MMILITSMEWLRDVLRSFCPLSLPEIREMIYLSVPLIIVAAPIAIRMVRIMYMDGDVTLNIVPSLSPVRKRLCMR